MSKRKDRERAEQNGGYRNQAGVSEATIAAIAGKVDVSGVTKKETSRMTLEEIKDCRRVREIGKVMPMSALKNILERNLPKDFKRKAGELKEAGLPNGTQDVVDYYWSEEEFQRCCTLAGITYDACWGLCDEALHAPEKPWYRRIL